MLSAKRLIQKAVLLRHHQEERSSLTAADLDLQVVVHYGIPSTASLLAFDSIQRLLAIATLDGRLKVFGGDGIEVIFTSPKQLPYKNIEVWFYSGDVHGLESGEQMLSIFVTMGNEYNCVFCDQSLLFHVQN
uniref:Uncharacterized protein n=1 Tax=Salix viminalis TaxID=40686 RepID=A0A6N2KMC9_SALVM